MQQDGGPTSDALPWKALVESLSPKTKLREPRPVSLLAAPMPSFVLLLPNTKQAGPCTRADMG